MNDKVKRNPEAKNHNVGDVLIVKANYNMHMFKIGEQVTVLTKNEDDYYCENQVGKKWYLTDAELKTIPNQLQSNEQ